MDTTTTDAGINAMETEKIDEIDTENVDDSTLENQQQQRQDFTSETFKIEIRNMGKFAFGVCSFILDFNEFF